MCLRCDEMRKGAVLGLFTPLHKVVFCSRFMQCFEEYEAQDCSYGEDREGYESRH